MAIGGEHVETTLGYGCEYQSEDTERSKLNDPLNGERDNLREVLYHVDGRLAGFQLQGYTNQDGPKQDTDIVGLRNRQNGIGYHIGQEVREHIGKRPWSRTFDDIAQLHFYWKRETAHHGTDGRNKRAEHIARDDDTETWTKTVAGLCDAGSH